MLEAIWLVRGESIMIHSWKTYLDVSPKLDHIGRDSTPYLGSGWDGAFVPVDKMRGRLAALGIGRWVFGFGDFCTPSSGNEFIWGVRN